MQEKRALKIFKEAETIRNGHFVLNSGQHAGQYIQKDRLNMRPWLLDELADDIASRFVIEGIEVVVGPALGAIDLKTAVARALRRLTGHEVLCVYAQQDERLLLTNKSQEETSYVLSGSAGSVNIALGPGNDLVVKMPRFVLKRGYDQVVKGKRVLAVDDILTTGASARRTVQAVKAAGGEVAGVAALCNRGRVTRAALDDAWLLYSVLDLNLETHDPANCPLCKLNVPIDTDLGHGATFLARQRGVESLNIIV